jgi:hypothetical protein
MARVSSQNRHLTSVSLRPASARRFEAALKILRRNGLNWSESQLLQRLAEFYLRHWRGRGGKSDTLQRKNRSITDKLYVRYAWYVEKELHTAVRARAVHSGQSISRMLDFVIRIYLPRFMEEQLRKPVPHSAASLRNASYWEGRFRKRPYPKPAIFVTYQCTTNENSVRGLSYLQQYQIHPRDDCE